MGRTSRNQPTAPAMATTAPSMLSDSAVTNPANTSVIPKARASGHAVGAGISILSGICIAPLLNSDNVNNSENDYPNCVHEVPVHCQDLHPLRVFGPKLCREVKNCHGEKSEQSYCYVKRVETDQRIISGAEQI